MEIKEGIKEVSTGIACPGKGDFRKKVFALRNASEDHEILAMSRIIADRLLLLPEFSRAELVLSYASYRHEVDTWYLIGEAQKAGKVTALPRVDGKEMDFYPYTPSVRMERSSMGILEPQEGMPVLCSQQDETAPVQENGKVLMIMPGVAFDRSKNRIGYGGGYYDRYLSEHPGIVRIAIAFGFQLFDEIPSEVTDIRPDLIITEKEIIR